jgi:hypothetical protein
MSAFRRHRRKQSTQELNELILSTDDALLLIEKALARTEILDKLLDKLIGVRRLLIRCLTHFRHRPSLPAPH